MRDKLYVDNYKKNSTLFFHFSSEETKEELVKRLQEAKQIGLYHIIASYKTQGMQPAKFDETYFNALDRLVDACREQEVQFWLEDYAPFPTGNANGAYQEAEYADLNKLFIDERHIDISGPVVDAVIRIDSLQSVVYGKAMHRFAKVDPSCRKRVGIVACRMQENSENAASPFLEEATAILLDEFVENGFLKWDVPEGQWRIFVIYTTYESSGRAGFMNLLSKASVALEIEKVHKPLYEHLKEEIRKTWIGFFYDEPEVGNAGGDAVFDFFMLPGRRTLEQTDCNVFSWSPEMPQEMEKRDPDWIRKLPCLWYDGLDTYRDFRCQYMDAVSSLVQENYNGQVYAFCQEKGISYIGHVLEDENCHTRLGCGPSHYFRQQYYQDEAGIDVIAGQILPGKDHAASWYGVVNSDGEFYHYGLAKLASSEAHINPLKKNRAATECFAMYGQQGLSERKFLLDHLMVNGVNRMLLAELPSYQASSEYSKAIVEYTDRMCGLLRASEPVIKTAILYHAEAEWREGEKAQKFQKAGAALARNQISYDVIPADVFTFPERYNTKTENGLTVNENTYEAFIVPACSKLPESVVKFVKQCEKTGFPIFFVNRIPEGLETTLGRVSNVRCTALADLAKAVKKAITQDIFVEASKKEWIRYSHVKQGEDHFYLLHNEAPNGGMDCQVIIEAEGEILVWDPMTDMMIRPNQETLGNGEVRVSLYLEQYEMKVLYISGKDENYKHVIQITEKCNHAGDWEVEFPDGHKLQTDAENLPQPETYIGYDFYGKLIYRTIFNADGSLPKLLDLGKVSDCCEVLINGQSIGKRAASPYLYDVQNKIRKGENEIIIEVYTSAGNMKSPAKIFGIPMDTLTAIPYALVESMGIRGPVKWLF